MWHTGPGPPDLLRTNQVLKKKQGRTEEEEDCSFVQSPPFHARSPDLWLRLLPLKHENVVRVETI